MARPAAGRLKNERQGHLLLGDSGVAGDVATARHLQAREGHAIGPRAGCPRGTAGRAPGIVNLIGYGRDEARDPDRTH
jgi:hypothetical protein